MTDRIGVTQGGPSTSFWLEGDYIGTDARGHIIRCYLRAANGPGGDASSRYLGAGYQAGSIDGIGEWGRHSGNPFLPGGYAQNQLRWRDGPWDVAVPITDPDGITLRMALLYGSVNAQYIAGLAVPPPIPVPLGFDQIGPTSMRFMFSGTGNGGSPILEWQAGIADNPSFLNPTIVSSSGTTTFTGLVPGRRYWAAGRGRNAIGWGAWSVTANASTLVGGRIRDVGVYKYALPFVRDGGVYKQARALARDGGIYKPTG